MSVQYTQCRYLKPRAASQCSAEAVDPDGEVLLCARHLALAMEMTKRRMAEAKKAGVATTRKASR